MSKDYTKADIIINKPIRLKNKTKKKTKNDNNNNKKKHEGVSEL